MKFKVIKARVAQAEIDAFAQYATQYSESFAREQFIRLNRMLTVDLAETPFLWTWFYITGAPYRACLFKVGRRTSYWIVYTIDEKAQQVDVLRFWNASQDGDSFDV